MNKLYLSRISTGEGGRLARLALYIKGDEATARQLPAYLAKQNIKIEKIDAAELERDADFSYFNLGYRVELETLRWSFYSFKSLLNSFLSSLDEDVLLRSSIKDDLRSADAEEKVFDDRFFIELIRKIDRCEDLYYYENTSITLFINSILKILNDNLELNWSAISLQDVYNPDKFFTVHAPVNVKDAAVAAKIENPDQDTLVRRVEFAHRHIADIILSMSPYSPVRKRVEKFVDFLVMNIDEFLYGHLLHRREVLRLKAEIARLKGEPGIVLRENTADNGVHNKLRILVLGGSQVNNEIILAECRKAGFNRDNIDLHTEYAKLTGFDTNNLLKTRSHYAGILVGPVPHKMKHTDNLVSRLENEPERYPPFVILQDKENHLKITRNTLKKGLERLKADFNSIDSYAV